MQKLYSSIKILTIFLVAEIDASAQTFFQEDFGPAGISTNLIAPSDYIIHDGKIGVLGDKSGYVRTVDTAYKNTDFTMGITVHLNNASGGQGIAWVGIGSGLPDPNWSDQPTYAAYAVLQPQSWGGGGFGTDYVEVPSLLGQQVSAGTASWNARAISTAPLGDLLRLEITKSADNLTFRLDPNFTNSFFNPIFSDSFSLSGNLAFLNDTNSRIFFGAGGGTQFSALSIVPEPCVFSLLILGLGGLVTRRRRRS